MDAKDAAILAKRYFEETKSTKYFLFDASNVTKQDGQWKVSCEVRELFEEGVKRFGITIVDEDGAILDVKRLD